MDVAAGTMVPETPAAPAPTVMVGEYNGVTISFDCAEVPGEARLELLKKAVDSLITNRVNQVVQRHAKDEKVKAWNAYELATKADPLQTTVTKPEGDKPAGPDVQGAVDRALEDLRKGELRQRAPKGQAKARPTADALTKHISDVVAKEVFDARKEAGEKVTFLAVKAAVGDGIKYLKDKIEERVAAGGDRAALEKFLEDRYLKPARIMLGLDDKANKKFGDLQGIL